MAGFRTTIKHFFVCFFLNLIRFKCPMDTKLGPLCLHPSLNGWSDVTHIWGYRIIADYRFNIANVTLALYITFDVLCAFIAISSGPKQIITLRIHCMDKHGYRPYYSSWSCQLTIQLRYLRQAVSWILNSVTSRPILWNAVTSPKTVLNGNSVKTKLYKTHPLYSIVLASLVTAIEVKAIEFHRIGPIGMHIAHVLFKYEMKRVKHGTGSLDLFHKTDQNLPIKGIDPTLGIVDWWGDAAQSNE